MISLLLLVVLPFLSGAPAKGVFPDVDKTQIYANYYKFLPLEDHLQQLHYRAIAKENYFFEHRANKTEEAMSSADRLISGEIYGAMKKFSYDAALQVDDIDGFLNKMDSEYQRLEKEVREMKKRY